MKTNLVVFGPIEIPYIGQKEKRIHKDEIRAFWDKKEAQEIAPKQGCYIFGMRVARGFTPWYIGKATKSFVQEIFQSHKITQYNDVLFHRKGTPVMFFVAQPGTLRKIPARTIDDIETYLIQTAVYKNPNLNNTAKTKSLPNWGIKGIVRGGSGKPSPLSRTFKKMMGL